MGRNLGGIGLIALALFMLFGFLRADLSGSLFTNVVAFAVAVVLPAATGIVLVSGISLGRSSTKRREELRRETVMADVLRLADARGGKLTVVEVITELAIPPHEAKESLDSLAGEELADLEVTDSGMLVYVFRDVQRLSEKARSRGVLDD